jgi:CheY-like chemotaxis protein
MTPEVMKKVFEPFFTTKPEGRGTGLGLSMVYGFVRQSGGHIRIDSEVGQGTTIRLYLPRSLQSEEPLIDMDAMPVVGGSEMVLVAEDDEAVRETVVALLNDLGYRVLKAKDAQSALSIIESGMPIDLLFTDVVMPGTLKSTELARKARERIPHLAVLFTSGYSQDAITNSARQDENVELLSKPYSRDALARKLRHVLANATQKKLMQANFDAALLTGKYPQKKVLSVLVCEDEPLILYSTIELVRRMGHQATPAADARTALSILATKPIDIVLTDVGLPDMSGAKLAEEAVLQNPELAVIFASGQGQDSDVQSNNGAITLPKPFSYDALAEAIASAARKGRRP